jgi:hypothetical protein
VSKKSFGSPNILSGTLKQDLFLDIYIYLKIAVTAFLGALM